VAIIAASQKPAALDYLSFLGSDAAAAVFRKNGFTPLE
jgi:ABC-type molybdate transport system substrate-binding protein